MKSSEKSNASCYLAKFYASGGISVTQQYGDSIIDSTSIFWNKKYLSTYVFAASEAQAQQIALQRLFQKKPEFFDQHFIVERTGFIRSKQVSTAHVSINGDKLYRAIQKKKHDVHNAVKKIGYTSSYIATSAANGRINKIVLSEICEVIGKRIDDFVTEESVPRKSKATTPMKNNTRIDGKKLNDAISKNELTKAEICRAAGITRHCLDRAIQINRINDKRLEKVCKALAMFAGDFIVTDDEKPVSLETTNMVKVVPTDSPTASPKNDCQRFYELGRKYPGNKEEFFEYGIYRWGLYEEVEKVWDYYEDKGFTDRNGKPIKKMISCFKAFEYNNPGLASLAKRRATNPDGTYSREVIEDIFGDMYASIYGDINGLKNFVEVDNANFTKLLIKVVDVIEQVKSKQDELMEEIKGLKDVATDTRMLFGKASIITMKPPYRAQPLSRGTDF